MFIKIEKQLELKNIAINYTNDKLISSLMELKKRSIRSRRRRD